jgi:hypothetical protein
MLRTARQTKTCVVILKSVDTTTGSVEFFNRLLIRPEDVLVPSPADPPKIYPRINRSGVIRLLSLGLPRRAPVFRQIWLLLGLLTLHAVIVAVLASACFPRHRDPNSKYPDDHWRWPALVRSIASAHVSTRHGACCPKYQLGGRISVQAGLRSGRPAAR